MTIDEMLAALDSAGPPGAGAALADMRSARNQRLAQPVSQADQARLQQVQAMGNRPGVGTYAGMAAQGLSLGAGDEIMGAMSAVGGLQPDGQGGSQWFDYSKPFGERYAIARDAIRDEMDAFRSSNPVTATGLEIAGAMAVPVGGAMRGATTLGRVARGALSGAMVGSAYGFNDAEGGLGPRIEGARDAAVLGGAVGAAVPAVAAGYRAVQSGRAAGKAIRQAAKAAPSVDDLAAQAGRLYDDVQARGVNVAARSYDGFADGLRARLMAEGADPVWSKPWAALQRVESLKGKDVSFQQLDIARKIAQGAARSQDRNEARLGSMLVDGIDDYIVRLVDGDLAGGTAAGLADDLKAARELWRRMRNSETLGKAIERAGDQASGFENGIRIQFRAILNNPKISRFLNDGEKEAVRAVVRGSTVGNILKRVAMLSPGAGQQRNPFAQGGMASGAVIGAQVGNAIAGMPGLVGGAVAGAALPSAIGYGAQRGAEALTQRAAQRAQAAVAAGVPAIPPPGPVNALSQFFSPVIPGGVAAYQAVRP
jgi:hypothetical protein